MATFPTPPAVGDYATAAFAGALASGAVIADSGATLVTPTAVNTAVSQTVTFNKTFPAQPVVVLTPVMSANPQVASFAALNITTTGFTIRFARSDATTATTIGWIALGTQ